MGCPAHWPPPTAASQAAHAELLPGLPSLHQWQIQARSSPIEHVEALHRCPARHPATGEMGRQDCPAMRYCAIICDTMQYTIITYVQHVIVEYVV